MSFFFLISRRSRMNGDSIRFYNGGLLFSSVTFVFIAFISLYSFLLLVKTKIVVPGSFGGIVTTLCHPSQVDL